MPFPDELARGVRVVDYDPCWACEFRDLAGRIQLALGPLNVRIDHIGSTAVPGLPAKDCIDAQVRVAGLDDARIVAGFVEIGFRLRPEEWNRAEVVGGQQWPKLVFAPPRGERAVNVHVRLASSASARQNLLFRDYLSADESARRAWGQFEQRLAQTATNLADYGQVKQPATEVLMIAAEGWARRTRWRAPAR